jgi:hypothetical protein
MQERAGRRHSAGHRLRAVTSTPEKPCRPEWTWKALERTPFKGRQSEQLHFGVLSRVLNPSHPSAVHQGIAFITHVLLRAISLAMIVSLVRAQSLSAQRETPVPHGASKEGITGPCSLRVPDTFPQLPADGKVANPASIYVPLSARCKFNLFLIQTYSPYTFASAAFQATEAQATDQWPHYGGGTQGWAKRLGATLANTESRRFIQGFALSTILHQDPRYFPSPKRKLFLRAWYATTRVVITKNDNGDSTFNTSEILGALFTSSLQNTYYPRHDRTLGDTMNRFSGALASDAIGDLLREFTPDMKRLFRKHAPKKILKIEEKLPIPAEDKP